MEPDFKEGDQVLVSTLNFNNLKGPKKMRDSFVGLSTIIKLIGKNAVEVKHTEEFSRKHPVFPGQEDQTQWEGSKTILVRFKNQTADKDKWLAEDAIPDGNLHLRRFRAFRRTEQSHKG
ncbi:hypothetical protein O181_034260 [Austropuccinia psidii MF-1]|uniref:Uncharacterized protein n=1 Tax=Austropuccinia psidii MF-1 TaxID=1389203 RepID=A0A9Q3HA10_9BASI|nr:hypothetical protein [Austropuccinia psidii MF-1]